MGLNPGKASEAGVYRVYGLKAKRNLCSLLKCMRKCSSRSHFGPHKREPSQGVYVNLDINTDTFITSYLIFECEFQDISALQEKKGWYFSQK